ncbi:MAG TPA: cell division protein FtsQ/DivIB [Candidatus Methylomirabilis sp.]|nr:cell division protein FtsQ/DivIB [Candidatus Methylomirabilis sp.]
MSVPVFNNRQRLLVDYHQKKLENPFFKRRERINHLSGLRLKLIALAAVIILALAAWFFIYAPFWQINKIIITGADAITTAEINQIASTQTNSREFLILPQNNLLLFNEKKFRFTVKNEFRLQKISIVKKWPSTLAIDIVEKPLTVIWEENNIYYYIDSDGYVTGQADSMAIKNEAVPLLINQSEKKILNSRIQADQIYLTAAAAIYIKFPQRFIDMNIESFSITDEMNTLKMQITAGPQIIFDPTGDIDQQLDRLYVLKTQMLKDGFNLKKSIDLRFGDKIYYQ